MKKKGYVIRKIESEKDLGDMNFILKDHPLDDLLGLYVEDDEKEMEVDASEKLKVGFMVVVHGRLNIEQAAVYKSADGAMIIEPDELESLF